MRKVIELNNDWYFKLDYADGMELNNQVDGFEKVNLPHNTVEVPYNYFDESIYQRKSIYKYKIKAEKTYKGKAVYINFQGVMSYAKVFLNGIYLGEHKGGYTPFDIRIDNAVNYSSDENVLSVVVDSSEIDTIPPFGGQIDYLTYGGIYREVSISIYDNVFIDRVKIETPNVLDDKKNVEVYAYINNLDKRKENVDFRIDIISKDGKIQRSENYKRELKPFDEVYLFKIENLNNIKLWDIDEPNLYEIRIKLISDNLEDEYKEKFGFRKAEFTSRGFYLNGKRLKIRGLNRHQSYPYVGYAMPKRVQEKDAVILKEELHGTLRI